MRKTSFPGNLYYLTEELPARYGVVTKLIERLEAKNLRSSRGLPYNVNIINNILRGLHQDDQVKAELILMVAEAKGKRDAVEKILNEAYEAIKD